MKNFVQSNYEISIENFENQSKIIDFNLIFSSKKILLSKFHLKKKLN